MNKASLSNKVFTENPLLDEIVYNARQLATETVLKDFDKANNNETLESIQNGDILTAINRGTIAFENFYYDEEILRSVLGDDPNIRKYILDNKTIPKSVRPALLNKAVELFTENYEETNNYYRMLHGDPYYDETGTYEGLWIDANEIDDTIPTSISSVSTQYKEEYDNYGNVTSDYQLIHELSITRINMLQSNGTLENIINDTATLASWGMTQEEVRYLNFLGDKSIDYYSARSAERFAMLYCPSCDSEEVKQRYKDIFEANRLYLLYTVYSEAYKFKSDYYDNFMMIFLIIQTIIDMIIELPEYIIRRDIFDTRTCKYIFESNGVKYFKDIPLRYQISLVKNLNKLIKFKSTDKCILDIVSLFGFDNINVFKYYILKDRNVRMLTEDERIDPVTNTKLTLKNVEVVNGTIIFPNDTSDSTRVQSKVLILDESNWPKIDANYYDNKKEVTDSTGKTSIVEDNDKNYELRFIRVPLQGMYDDYIRADKNLRTYDELTESDNYWIGDKEYETIKSSVKDLDFTVLRSKYYSVEAIVDLAKRNFTLTYFMNILMYNKVNKDSLKLSIPTISTTKKVTLVNAIMALYSLGYIYYGSEDTIMDRSDKIAQILGFNMEADLGVIAQNLKDYHGGMTLDDLCYAKDVATEDRHGFQVPDAEKIISYEQLQNIFRYNKKIYDHVIEVMKNPPSKEVYNAYRYLYNSLFIMNRNMEYFLVGDNSIVDEYKKAGYTTYFFVIPREENYVDKEHYELDYKWFLTTLKENVLYFEQSESFEEDHTFDLYIFNGTDIEPVNEYTCPYCSTRLSSDSVTSCPHCHKTLSKDTIISGTATARMAATYREYLRYNDTTLYSYLENIASMTNSDTRQEICINAIQQIVGYMKDYIDEDGVDSDSTDDIRLDEVFSGLPSISLEFVKDYIKEVIDFFKSFKIFTHDSSIIYIFDDKFENYIQLIDHVLLKYLFDKSEYIKIEDWIAANKVNLTHKEKSGILDKVWFSIDTWISKFYSEYYNNDNYSEAQNRIKDLYQYWSTMELSDIAMEEKYITQLERFAVDAILRVLVDFTLEDKYEITDAIAGINDTLDIDTHYEEWISDLLSILISFTYEDGIESEYHYFCNHCGKEVESDDVIICPHCKKIIEDAVMKMHYKTHITDDHSLYSKLVCENNRFDMTDNIGNSLNDINSVDKYNLQDGYYKIITTQFPAHVFDE